MIIKRMLAELVDLVVNVCLLVFEVIFVLPLFEGLVKVPIIYLIFALGSFWALIILAQGLFWAQGESIGKYFMRLEVVTIVDNEKATFELMVVREFFVKYITFYFSSIPLLFGKESVQEKATGTLVRSKRVETKV
ncbi:RDD family protein [Mollicutes bacterium LVI A0039]|nr:RDD family protein [Mollicutes bacterium LVI A0039]